MVVEAHDIVQWTGRETKRRFRNCQPSDLFAASPDPGQHEVEGFVWQPAAIDTGGTDSRYALLLACCQETISSHRAAHECRLTPPRPRVRPMTMLVAYPSGL